MPIFEYRCAVCGNAFEKLVLPTFSRDIECPSCHSQDVEKLISLSAVSSGQTQKRARQDGVQRGKALRQDLSNEEYKRIISHESDHHDH